MGWCQEGEATAEFSWFPGFAWSMAHCAWPGLFRGTLGILQQQGMYKSWEKEIPSGERLHNYGKSPCSMGKSTMSMAIFNSKLLVYQRVNHPSIQVVQKKSPQYFLEGGLEWYISVWIEVLNASTKHVKDLHILSQQQIVIFEVCEKQSYYINLLQSHEWSQMQLSTLLSTQCRSVYGSSKKKSESLKNQRHPVVHRKDQSTTRLRCQLLLSFGLGLWSRDGAGGRTILSQVSFKILSLVEWMFNLKAMFFLGSVWSFYGVSHIPKSENLPLALWDGNALTLCQAIFRSIHWIIRFIA